jgi:hypothetical protein
MKQYKFHPKTQLGYEDNTEHITLPAKMRRGALAPPESGGRNRPV